MSIRFTSHAEAKFGIFKRYGCQYSKVQIEDVVRHPEKVMASGKGRKVAQKRIDEEHVLRVIFEQRGDDIVIVTFYPARRERYEAQLQ